MTAIIVDVILTADMHASLVDHAQTLALTSSDHRNSVRRGQRQLIGSFTCAFSFVQ